MKKIRWGIVELRHVKAELGYPATRSSTTFDVEN